MHKYDLTEHSTQTTEPLHIIDNVFERWISLVQSTVYQKAFFYDSQLNVVIVCHMEK